jgi:hypothetical protein
MSDYLGRLAARTIATHDALPAGEIVRPRMLSAFEPPDAAIEPIDARDRDAFAQAQDAVAGVGPLPAAPHLPPALDRQHPAEQTRPQAPPGSSALQGAMRPGLSATRQSRLPDQSDPPEPSPHARPPIRAEAVGAMGADLPEPTPSRLDARHTSADALTAPRIVPAPPTPTIASPPALAPTADAAMPESTRPLTRAEAPTAQAADPVAALPSLRAASASPIAPQFPAAALQPPAPPTIRVTIGRIEVRAITPPARPAPRATSERRGPALSLDGYLKRRNGGT